MSFIGNEGIAPTIQLDSVGIGFQVDADGNAINVDGIDLNRNEYLVVGEKTYYPDEDNQRNTKWSLLVNSDGVAVNTSRNSSSNFLNSDTSFFVDKNFYCAGIVKAAGLELNDIILDGDPLTSSLIRDFIINANNISANQPFQAGLNTSYEDVYNYNYFVKNVFTPNFVTLGGHVDTYDNTHPLNIVSTANNKFNSMHIAIRNDTNNEEEPTKFGFGIIGGSNISPAIISTTKGTPLEFHISKSSSNIDELYGTSAIPVYTNSNQYPALAIDENNNIAIGINKTSPRDYTRKVLNNGEITSEDIIDENIKLQVNGVSCFNEIIMYDYFTNTHKALDDIYIRSSGISTINSTQISEGDFLGTLYNFNNITINDLLKTSNLTIDNDINVNNNIQTSSLIVDNVANFSGIVQFDNEVNFNNAQSVSINKLKINDDIYIGDRKIIPIDIDDPATGYGTYSRSEDGSNYFFVYVHSNIATLDANCNISFPKKMAIGLTESDGFDGVLNIIKDDVTTSNNFDITMKNTVESKEYYANIGRLSRLDYGDNSLILNTNNVIGKKNNIYFYPSTDMSEITSNYYLPNIRTVPPTLSLNKERVGINKLAARVGYELDVEGKVAARDYYLTIGNEMQRTKGFIYQPKNFFNIYDAQTDKFCINYNNLTSYASSMKGLNVKRGINSDYYYQNDKIIETLQMANNTDSFHTNKKISLGWAGEDVSAPLQIRNLTTEDNNYSVLRIYRGVKGGGANNNANYSGIDICEYDRNLDTDRNAERWFIYKNHTFNDVDSRNIQRIGPLQIGYIDKDVKPKTYGMSFYYNTENSNYHIDVNKNTVSYEDNNSAMSIYGDLDVHGNINIIDKYGSNYNFRLDNLQTLTQITQYITTVETIDNQESPLGEDSGQPSGNNDIRYTGYNILYTPNRSVIIDPIEKKAIPIIVKQDNSNLAAAKFITYSDNASNCSSFLELAIYNCNLLNADDNYEKEDNIKNMIKFNLSSEDDKHTYFDMSFYHEDYYKKFYNFKNNIDDSGNFLGSSTHIGIGNNIDNNSNVAFHIDDINKYGLQITNSHHAPAINLLYTGATCNIYHTLSGSSFENNYRFSIDVANKSTFNEPESSNVFIIDAFDGNKLRKGARFGFNDDILAESFVIKTDYDTPAMAITSRYTSEYVFDSVVDIIPENLTLATLSSNWNNVSKEYSVTYNYGVSYFPDIDNNLNPISYINKLDPNFLFKSSTSQSSNIIYNTFHSNLNIDYNVSNLNVDFNNYKTSILNVTNYDIANNITTCTLDFTTELLTCNISLVPQLSFDNNTITIDDSKSSIIIIEDSFSCNLALIDNVASNYDFTYNYSNVVFLPEYLNCNITYISYFNSNIVDDSNMIYVNNEIYTDILPFDSDEIFYEYMNTGVETRSLVDNGIYTNIFLETTTSNIVRINSNIELTGKFTAERQNTILFMTSNILPNALINLEQDDNNFEYTYNIQVEDDSSNVYIISSNFVVNNNVNSIPRDMELTNVNSDYLIEDVFEIYNNTFTNKIYLNEFFNKLSPIQDQDYIIRIKNYNYKNFKPHITLSNDVESLDRIAGHEVYSYDGVLEIKYVDSSENDSWVPLKIDAEGNAFIRGGLDMGGNIRFDGKIYDANGNDLIEILNKNYYKEYEINSSNIHFNSLGSNGVEIHAYSSSNHDDFKFFYAQDFLDDGIINDVMILHKRLDEATQYKIDLYGDIDTSNGILRVEGRDVILDSCNYILDTSNVISNRISDLETDFISEEAHSSNRFIVDHNYDYNMSISGDLVVHSNLIIHSNLTVLGEFTTLNTEVYTTEQIDITNHGQDIALKIKQTEDYKIVGIFDDSSEVFTIAYSGNVGIHSDNPIVSLDINNTDAIHLPRGNVSERPTQDKTGDDLTSLQGIIRFNNEYGQFEGFGSNNQWGVLGGIRDADRDTYIIAEQEAGTDDDYLLFVTAGSEKMVIKDDGRIGIGMSAPTYYLDVVGDIRAASNLYIGSNFGINNETPFVTMDVNTTDSIKIPKGDISQRPVDNDETDVIHRGYMRFNTQLEQFEGYGEGNKWGVLGGVKDADRDTYIIAEDYAGNDNDELKLVTAGSERMIVKADGKIGIGMSAPTYYLDVVGDIRAASNLYIGSNFGINNETPFVTMDINTTDSIKIPRGNIAQRPVSGEEQDTDLSIHKGYIRYNTDLEQFEGFGAGNKWGSLGGIKDVDGDTYISAENSAGDDNDELKFFTSNLERMVISSNGFIGIGTKHPNYVIDVVGGVNIITEGNDYIFTINDRDIIQESCNYTTDTSNVISNRISDLETDFISEEAHSSNRFIVDHTYNYDLYVNGDLTASNLTIHGTTTTLNTDIYVTEQLDVQNSGAGIALNVLQQINTGVAFNIQQNDTNCNILNISNSIDQVFTITNDGSVGIGVTNPDNNGNLLDVKGNINIITGGEDYIYTIDGRDIIQESCNYTTRTSNVISNRISDLETDFISEEAHSSNRFIVDHKYDNDLLLNGTLTINSNLILFGDTDVALKITQNGNQDIVNIYNDTDEIFTILQSGFVGINTETPLVSLEINTTDSIKIPVGTSDERPTENLAEGTNLSLHRGYIRFNTDLEQFEGFGAGNTWGSLGGIKDIDGDTYVTAENSAGDDNDELKFFTSNLERMVISSNGFVGIGVTHPEHIIDIEGNGRISDSLYIGNKIGINNDAPLVSLEINATDSIKIPVGTSDERPTEGLAEGVNLSLHRGYIRFNSDLEQFEGFGAGNTWGSLGGIKDIDGDTYVTAENNAGDDNDELKFFTSNLERMVITSNGLVGIGTTSPDKNLTIYSENASLSIQDPRNNIHSVSSIELVNGSNNDFDKNELNYGWRISSSNDLFNITCGSNNAINDRFIIDGKTGNIGIGTKPHIYESQFDEDEFKVNIVGSLNIEGDIYRDGTLFFGSGGGGGGGSMGVVSQNMTVQTMTETYTATPVMSENDSQNGATDKGWKFIDNDLDTGFVIKIKPTHRKSKVLLNLSCHIGFDSTLDSRWWGIRLYRKIGGDEWTEVKSANGNYNSTTEDNSDPASIGGSNVCWLSHNLGANLSSYENFVANVSGSFCDSPDTRKEVYYTVKWKSRLGDPSSYGGSLYLNRPAKYNAAFTPVLSSSWVAQELWQLGTPYIPANGSNIITLYNQDYVGIGNTEPVYELDLIGNFRSAGDIFVDGKIGVNTYSPAFSLDIIATDGIKIPSGNNAERPNNSTIVKGVIRYNTESEQFEGYGAGNAWGSLGGVKDVDGDTYISAENNANDDNDELKFYTSNYERMVITSNGLIGIGTESPAFSLDINANDGLKLPTGDEMQRPDSSTIVKGVIRYNTDSDQFEGYGAGNAWGSLGGVKDVDGDTYISAENNANDDNDELKFYTSNYERMVITSNGLVGIGNTEPNYKIDVDGEINASAFNINGTPFRLEFPSGMTLQSKHLTFTDTCTKSDTEVDWVPVNNNLTSGFVIRVKPTHSSSKILLNLICHIGMDYLQDSRWWGLKLYRKIGTGNWNEITGANGTGSDNGSSCWISHNLGAESSIYSHSITNVTGSYEDEPQTTEDVYYTIYWKSRLDGTNGRLYLNKSAESIDTNYPKPSSSWSASEIWNNGVPYIPPPASSVISLSDNNVGIGIVPTIDSVYKLNVNGNIKCHNLFQTSDKRYKQNILPLDTALQLIDSIKPVSYTTLEESKRKYGFIAQDMEDIIPDIVNIPRDSNDLYSIDYISMIPLLTKSIQELSNIINNQQKELNELKSK